MFLAVSGKNKDKASSHLAVNHYKSRFDADGCYRFSKQHLFLDKFQTPDKTHFLSHLLLVVSAWWLLYAGKDEVSPRFPVWQQYLLQNKDLLSSDKDEKKPILALLRCQKV